MEKGQEGKLISSAVVAGAAFLGLPAAVGTGATVAIGIALYLGREPATEYFKKLFEESRKTNLNDDKERGKKVGLQEDEKGKEKIRNILIIGRTGAGKSTLANVLIGKEQKFKEVAGSTSGTQKKQKEIFEWKGTKYRIIDTIGQGNVSKLTKEEVEKKTRGLSDDFGKDGISQILFVFKDRFTEEQIETFEWLKSELGESELLYTYVTIVSTNFPEFENKEKCEEDKKRLLELKENKEIIEIISKCKMVHIDNPPIIGRSAKTNGEVREEARKILLNHLKSSCEYVHSLPPKLNTSLEEEIFSELLEVEEEWQQLENQVEVSVNQIKKTNN